ncbi:predicted protein [Micromonas commoda]|uniref:LysM domain-containing protein n=1 Tax=Micromonas commoda (strain RCC299 / NOUM17 / CCMP2709) TaxID=296587 RepID=C1FJ39_MICCC|nr:predicted protein [Micromonas commoda]ACO70288.1 predicted protein [Micromonas commoda]|eukprot:XP_002509030.1 predicted protein [Micromonas commoda]
MGEIEELRDDGVESPSEPAFRMHRVSSLDSLAGLAIKYGVTIIDIQRANGGALTDQTMFARSTVRIPRAHLGPGAPLPGGGGATGPMEPSPAQRAAMTPALAALRDHYGTNPKSELGSEGRAGGDGDAARRAFGSSSSRKTLSRASSSSGGEIAMTDRPSSGRANSSAGPSVADNEERMRALGLGGSGFQHGRSKPLMSPPAKAKASQSGPASSSSGSGSVMGFFDKMKRLANTPAMASSAASAGVGMKAAAAVASQRIDTGLREIGGPGLRKSSSLPAGRKGKGD